MSEEKPGVPAPVECYERADGECWPPIPAIPDLPATTDARYDQYRLALYNAQLDVRKKRTDQEITHAAAEVTADLSIEQRYYEAILGVAGSSIDRVRSSGETVQKAAAAVITLYTAILGVAFSIKDGHPLPGRGLFAGFFLALAILLSTVFLAYLPEKPKRASPAEGERGGGGAGAPIGEVMTDNFVNWCNETAGRRVWWLHSSIIALALALVFLPAPFLQIGSTSQTGYGPAWIWWAGAGVAVVLVVVLPLVIHLVEDREARRLARAGSAVQVPRRLVEKITVELA